MKLSKTMIQNSVGSGYFRWTFYSLEWSIYIPDSINYNRYGLDLNYQYYYRT